MRLFDDLASYIFAVIGTFKQDKFPNDTKNAVIALKDYVDNKFNKEAVRSGSAEHDAGIELSQGLERFLVNQILRTIEFNKARTLFKKTVKENFVDLIAALENHPAHKWSAFKQLLALIP